MQAAAAGPALPEHLFDGCAYLDLFLQHVPSLQWLSGALAGLVAAVLQGAESLPELRGDKKCPRLWRFTLLACMRSDGRRSVTCLGRQEALHAPGEEAALEGGNQARPRVLKRVCTLWQKLRQLPAATQQCGESSGVGFARKVPWTGDCILKQLHHTAIFFKKQPSHPLASPSALATMCQLSPRDSCNRQKLEECKA